MNEETWKPVPGYEGLYSASSVGRIRSETRIVRHYSGGPKRVNGFVMSPYVSTFGYHYITLCKNNVRTKFPVHRLVLMAFTGDLGAGLDARHLNGNRLDNRIENLAYGTRKENMADAITHGRTNRGTKNPSSKLTPDAVHAVRSLLGKQTQAAIARTFGVDPSVISDIKRGKLWSHVV